MATRIITCPHSQEPERITYQVHPLGILIDGCSRFCPAESVDCPRTCATELDRERYGLYDIGDVIEVSTLFRKR